MLISMAPCHRKLLVCVPWGVTLSLRAMPPVAAATEAAFCQTRWVSGTASGPWDAAVNKR